MRKLLAPLVLATALAVGGATTAQATPSDLKLTIGPQATWISPTVLSLPVSYTCPVTFRTANVGSP